MLTDTLADFLFVTEQAGMDNLKTLFSENGTPEGNPAPKKFFTGNCMIDTLMQYRKKAALTAAVQNFGLSPKQYALVTLHRPSNVDTASGLETVVDILETIQEDIHLIFPLHPRTANNLDKFGLKARLEAIEHLMLIEPQGYLEFLNLLDNAAFALTDSGGIQDETTFLGIPCLTLRTTTERPVTLSVGTNELLPAPAPAVVRQKVRQILSGQWRTGAIPGHWDGQSARRIAEILVNISPHRH